VGEEGEPGLRCHRRPGGDGGADGRGEGAATLVRDGSGPRALQGVGTAAVVGEGTGPMAAASRPAAPHHRRGCPSRWFRGSGKREGPIGWGGSGWRRCLAVSDFLDRG
jgi:hypothetical protein